MARIQGANTSEVEVYLSARVGDWRVVGRSAQRNPPNQRPGKALILECTDEELSQVLGSKIDLSGLHAWYQNHLERGGFVGMALAELARHLQ